MQKKLISTILSVLFLAVAITPAQAAPGSTRADIVIVERDKSPENSPKTTAEAAASMITQEIILQAMSLIGVRYKWGGNSPETGLDCSGFIRYVFQKSVNIALPRSASAMSRIGLRVDKDELQPGDLVFFNTLRRQFSHVGLYLGNNKFIHAPSTGKNITIANMDQKYWATRYNGARRMDRENGASLIEVAAVQEEGGDTPILRSKARTKVSSKTGSRKKTAKPGPSATKQARVTSAATKAKSKKR